MVPYLEVFFYILQNTIFFKGLNFFFQNYSAEVRGDPGPKAEWEHGLIDKFLSHLKSKLLILLQKADLLSVR